MTLHGGHRLCWEDCGPDGRPRRVFSEPEASWGRRLVAALTRLLPVERHL